MGERLIGKVTHYFSRIGVAAVRLDGAVRLGDRLHFKGHTTDFYQYINSMQIAGNSVQSASSGQEVGIKVDAPVRERDEVYLVEG